MESPPSPHAPLPFAPGTGLRSKLAVLGHGAGEPEVSRLPTLLCSLSPPFPIFLACNFKNLNSGEKQREYTNTQEKKNPKNFRVLYRELLHVERKKTCQDTYV